MPSKYTLKTHITDGAPWHGEGRSITRTKCGRIVDLKQAAFPASCAVCCEYVKAHERRTTRGV